jgi:hypothetical protein
LRTLEENRKVAHRRAQGDRWVKAISRGVSPDGGRPEYERSSSKAGGGGGGGGGAGGSAPAPLPRTIAEIFARIPLSHFPRSRPRWPSTTASERRSDRIKEAGAHGPSTKHIKHEGEYTSSSKPFSSPCFFPLRRNAAPDSSSVFSRFQLPLGSIASRSLSLPVLPTLLLLACGAHGAYLALFSLFSFGHSNSPFNFGLSTSASGPRSFPPRRSLDSRGESSRCGLPVFFCLLDPPPSP